ncbi:hypothetical protein CC80DRAFT_588495 [Byssothecium circinans]|uniref:Uncharacterized protein n=1 Tax=Byssothecium circinans TaxID=147558 RepID=A0A6A5UE35_9PLEO|nr:hypothetical protein CC80DRAFT_588495 [Byssothecium circinans]
MPASKRRKTGSNASAATAQRDRSRSSSPPNDENSPQNSNNGKRKVSKIGDIAPHAYFCIHRPLFDYKNENLDSDNGPRSSEDFWKEVYAPSHNAESKSNKIFQPASEHPEWEWVMMADAWDKFDLWRRRAKYCDPDNFNMYIYNDWKGYGLQEIIECGLAEFDKGFRKKGEKGRDEMWAAISALGLWLKDGDDGDMMMFINCEDGPTTGALNGLMGFALLTVLDAIKRAGELKRDSKYKDLARVIGYWLEWSHDLPNYGIEGEDVAWRPYVVTYFKEADLDVKKGTFLTEKMLAKLENAPNYSKSTISHVPDLESKADDFRDDKDPPIGTEQDPWAWKERIGRWKKQKGGKLGGQHYDITKLSRAERAAHVLVGEKVDPLKDVSIKDLRNNLLDFQ